MNTQSQQNWLVTGGTGFIGTALVRSLIKDGHKVTVLTRRPETALKNLPAGAHCIASLDDLPNNIAVNVIVNLAGEPLFGRPWTAKRKQAFFDSRLGTTQALVSLTQRLDLKPSVMISGSAIGYYGMSATAIFDETSPAGTDEMARLCREWETCAAPVSAEGIRLALLRTGLVLHPSGGMLQPLMLASKLGMGAMLGHGQQWMSWISLSDIVRLIIFIAANKNIAGSVNATAPNPIQQGAFADALSVYVGRPRFIRVPAAPLRIMLGDMADMLLEGQKVLPVKAQQAGFMFETETLKHAFQ